MKNRLSPKEIHSAFERFSTDYNILKAQGKRDPFGSGQWKCEQAVFALELIERYEGSAQDVVEEALRQALEIS